MGVPAGCEGFVGSFLSVVLSGPVDFSARSPAFTEVVPMVVVICDPARVEALNAQAAADPDFRCNDLPGCKLMTIPELEALGLALEI